MNWIDRLKGRSSGGEVRSVEDPTKPVSAHDFLEWLGAGNANLPAVTIESALQVTAVSAAVTFLSGTLAALPLQLFKKTNGGSEKISGAIAMLLQEAPNEQDTSFEWRCWFWQQVFTGGRGLSWIERSANGQPIAIWPMDPTKTQVERNSGRLWYHYKGQRDAYPASDVIDLAWMKRSDNVGHYSPIMRGSRAISDMLAMQQYSSNLFSKGGVPPLTLHGQIPTTGAEAMKRALKQVKDAVEASAEANIPIVQIPPGYELKAVGFNPHDGQMVDAKRFGIEEIARLYNLPPVFLQDLTHGTFSNTEQQDLHLTKHVVVRWAVAFEQQLNLKLFGHRSSARFVRHNVDGLQRGDFKSRMDGLTRGVMGGLLRPNEGRSLLDLPQSDQPGADELHMQGATVPLGSEQKDGSINAN